MIDRRKEIVAISSSPSSDLTQTRGPDDRNTDGNIKGIKHTQTYTRCHNIT